MPRVDPGSFPPRAPADSADGLAASLRELRSSLDLDEAYPAEAEAEARRAAREVPVDAAASGLEDLRDIEFLTIDPAGSTDLDQALHLERTPAGAVLHDAIADVPAFVAPGGALDAETRRRGQTMYAPDGRIPLHPPVLGDDAASLLPGVDRRAYVWRFELAREPARSRRRSCARARSGRTTRRSAPSTREPRRRRSAPWPGSERSAPHARASGAARASTCPRRASNPTAPASAYAAGLFRGAASVAFDGELPGETVQAAIGAPYAHTTAPLRRLVDRWVLVVCDALANGREVPGWARRRRSGGSAGHPPRS